MGTALQGGWAGVGAGTTRTMPGQQGPEVLPEEPGFSSVGLEGLFSKVGQISPLAALGEGRVGLEVGRGTGTTPFLSRLLPSLCDVGRGATFLRLSFPLCKVETEMAPASQVAGGWKKTLQVNVPSRAWPGRCCCITRALGSPP